MRSELLPRAAAALLLLASGCKESTPAAGAVAPDSAVSPDSAPLPSDQPVTSAGAAPETPPLSSGESGPSQPPPAARLRKPVARFPGVTGPGLPELSVKSFGLHVGGGDKDEETRTSYLRQLEYGFPAYLVCYRSMESPGRDGTFGADLLLPSEGGHVKVKQTRTRLPGEAFQRCMTRALESLRFKPPPSGRLVTLSYSVKFTLAE